MREGLICKFGEGCGYLFAKFPFVSFLSVRYKSDGLYCRMAGTPSSPTLFFKRKKVESREVEIKIKYKINITVEKRGEITLVEKGSNVKHISAGLN